MEQGIESECDWPRHHMSELLITRERPSVTQLQSYPCLQTLSYTSLASALSHTGTGSMLVQRSFEIKCRHKEP